MPQCSVPGCTETGANYMHFTWWRDLFSSWQAHIPSFQLLSQLGEWSMTDIKDPTITRRDPGTCVYGAACNSGDYSAAVRHAWYKDDRHMTQAPKYLPKCTALRVFRSVNQKDNHLSLVIPRTIISNSYCRVFADIHSHETNPKQLTEWWAAMRRELTVPYHGGATWEDFNDESIWKGLAGEYPESYDAGPNYNYIPLLSVIGLSLSSYTACKEVNLFAYGIDLYGGPKLPNTQSKTPTTIDLEWTTISLEGTTITLEGTTLSLEGTTIILGGTTLQFPSICTMSCHFYFVFVPNFVLLLLHVTQSCQKHNQKHQQQLTWKEHRMVWRKQH